MSLYDLLNVRKIIGNFKFSVIFPKTFAYLNFVVPLIRVKYVTKSLPDPVVKLSMDDSIDVPGRCYNFREIIVIYLLKCFKVIPSFKNKEEIIDFCWKAENNLSFQSVLIHEYEHSLQGFGDLILNEKWGIQLFSDVSQLKLDLSISIRNLLKPIYEDKLSNQELKMLKKRNWLMDPSEVEARVVQALYELLFDKKYMEPYLKRSLEIENVIKLKEVLEEKIRIRNLFDSNKLYCNDKSSTVKNLDLEIQFWKKYIPIFEKMVKVVNEYYQLLYRRKSILMMRLNELNY